MTPSMGLINYLQSQRRAILATVSLLFLGIMRDALAHALKLLYLRQAPSHYLELVPPLATAAGFGSGLRAARNLR